MNKNATYHDTDLREAVRRVEQQRPTPEPSADFLQAVMQQIQAEAEVVPPTHRPVRRRLWPWVAASIGATAAITATVLGVSSPNLPPDTSSVIEENVSVLTEPTTTTPISHPSSQMTPLPQVTQAKPSAQPSSPAPHSAPRKQAPKIKQEIPTEIPEMAEHAMSSNPPDIETTEQPRMSGNPIALSDLVAEPPVLSPEKQAMVNMYLAETALQVSYDRQAQQQAVRAYQTSITGQEEPAQHIIAF